MKRIFRSNKKLIIGGGLALLVIAGVYLASGSKASLPPAAPAVMPVVVKTLKEEPVHVWTEFSGRLQAVDSAEIRPEVSGRITKILFEDGQEVKAGDVIIVIDPRPYQAAVAKAEANLASATTNASFAKLELERADKMLKTQAVAQRIYDERANNARVTSASVKAAQAELNQAQLDLEHANVRAPISGRISRAEITVGNVVQAGPNAPLLTSIVSSKDLYASFDVDEQTYIKSVRSAASGSEEERQIPVSLTVGGDKENIYKGYIYSFDNKIDVTSGTIRARAKFENTDGLLVPGMFVSIALGNGKAENAIVIPEKIVGYDQNKKFVYVANAENKVEYRNVELGKQVGTGRIVLSGLAAGDRVITEGAQALKPDMKVEPKEEGVQQAAVKQQ